MYYYGNGYYPTGYNNYYYPPYANTSYVGNYGGNNVGSIFAVILVVFLLLIIVGCFVNFNGNNCCCRGPGLR